MRLPRRTKPATKHNDLFGPGKNHRLNACVGWNGGPADLARYAQGYFEAGKRLVESLRANPTYVDFLIYPLVNTYRQGIENMLKQVGLVLLRLCDEEGKIKLDHRLMNNWAIVRRCLEQQDVAAEELDRAEKTLKDLVEIDSTGQTFRYPTTKDGEMHLEETGLINVEVFAEGIGSLAQYLEYCHDWASEFLQQKYEMQREMAADCY